MNGLVVNILLIAFALSVKSDGDHAGQHFSAPSTSYGIGGLLLGVQASNTNPTFSSIRPSSSSQGSFIASSPSGSFNRPSLGSFSGSGSFNRPSSGSFVASSPSGSFSRPSSGSFNRPSSGSFNRPSSGSFVASSPSGSFNRPSSGSFSGSGSFNRPSSGSFVASSPGLFNHASSGTFGRPPTGAFNSPSNTGSNGGSIVARPHIAIISEVNNPPGTSVGNSDFSYAFETENGIKQQASGSTVLVGENEVVVMKGSYEYIGDDGLTYVVDWYADETGFHPSGPHLPKNLPTGVPSTSTGFNNQQDSSRFSGTGTSFTNGGFNSRPSSSPVFSASNPPRINTPISNYGI